MVRALNSTTHCLLPPFQPQQPHAPHLVLLVLLHALAVGQHGHQRNRKGGVPDGGAARLMLAEAVAVLEARLCNNIGWDKEQASSYMWLRCGGQVASSGLSTAQAN